MPTIIIHGASIDYKEQGSGETVVFVHGSASDQRTWARQQEHFQLDYRTIVYSRRYHWPNASIPDNSDYLMTEHVADLKELLSTLTSSPAHLVGHSYGAFVCLLLARQAPHLIRTLTLAEPPVLPLFVSNSPTPWELLKVLVTRPRTGLAILQLGTKGFAPATAAAEQGNMDEAMEVFGRAVLGDRYYMQLTESRRNQISANAIKAEFLGSGFPPLEASDLRHISPPTLLMNGTDSPAIFHRLLDRVEELMPHTERVHIPRASHIMHEDNPAEFEKALRAFLRQHGQST